MTINTRKLREAAANAKDLTAEDLIGFRLTATAHITGLARAIESCCDHIDAQAAEIAEAESQADRYRRAAGRWKKVAESAEGRVRDRAAEIARLLDAQAWQPIETAPHNETVLLGWRDWDDAWIEEVGMASWGWRNESVSNVSQHGRATHWMPLPAAPGALSGESHD